MMKSRRGAALVMALIVVLVGGFLISIIFDFVLNFGAFSMSERGLYEDHTALVSEVQAMEGRITAENLARDDGNGGNGAALHTPGLDSWHRGDLDATQLGLDDIRIDEWHVNREVPSEVGVRRVDVEVYDMYFEREWIRPDALIDKDFPPPLIMTGTGDESSGGPDDGPVPMTPENYGAYLIRARLSDGNGKLLRTIEEAFVLTYPPEE